MTMRAWAKALTLALGAAGSAACMGPSALPSGAGAGADTPAAGAETESFAPVTTEAAFREQVVGREVLYDNGATGSYGADNTWTVTGADGVLASGTWIWRDDRWCYGGYVGESPLAPRCDAVSVSGSGVRFTQEDGTVGTLRFRG